MDRPCIHDDHGIMGHNLVTFISLYLWNVIAQWISDVSLTSKYSPEGARTSTPRCPP